MTAPLRCPIAGGLPCLQEKCEWWIPGKGMCAVPLIAIRLADK